MSPSSFGQGLPRARCACIRFSDPEHAEEFHDPSRQAECVSVRTGDATLLVLHPFGVDETEARAELTFFVRAWRATRLDVDLDFAG